MPASLQPRETAVPRSLRRPEASPSLKLQRGHPRPAVWHAAGLPASSALPEPSTSFPGNAQQQLLCLPIPATSVEGDGPPACADPAVLLAKPLPSPGVSPGTEAAAPPPRPSAQPHSTGAAGRLPSTPGPCRSCRGCHSNWAPGWDPFPSLPRSLAQLPGGWGDANQLWQGHCPAPLSPPATRGPNSCSARMQGSASKRGRGGKTGGGGAGRGAKEEGAELGKASLRGSPERSWDKQETPGMGRHRGGLGDRPCGS